jgi:indole-3-glycerol phosphate synthase
MLKVPFNWAIFTLMILDDIIAAKTAEVKDLNESRGVAYFAEKAEPSQKDFTAAVKTPVSLIAEVKKASPSAGVIRRDFDPVKTALLYEASGASAVSVLTDEKFFKGSLKDLSDVAAAVKLPVLRKDFIIDEIQIYEARCAGADAVLLIAAVLSDRDINKFSATAKGLGMAALVEVHDRPELERALACGARMIGINNRDLRTFKVDTDAAFELAGLIPERDEYIVVSESGIRTPEDVGRLKSAGINAALIGEELMGSSDAGKRIRELGFK